MIALSVETTRGRPAPSATALLGDAAVVIWNDILPEGRDAFYAWHDKEHVPERLALPGFRRGRRFIRPGHSPEWLTNYEADDVKALASPAYLARLNAPTPATVSALRFFANTSRAVCRVAHSVGSSTGGHVLAMRLSVPGERAPEVVRFLSEDAFPRAIALTGVLACHLLEADRDASSIRTAESRDRALDVPSWVVLCEASMVAGADAVRAIVDGAELRRAGATVREDAAVYALEICRLSSADGGERT